MVNKGISRLLATDEEPANSNIMCSHPDGTPGLSIIQCSGWNFPACMLKGEYLPSVASRWSLGLHTFVRIGPDTADGGDAVSRQAAMSSVHWTFVVRLPEQSRNHWIRIVLTFDGQEHAASEKANRVLTIKTVMSSITSLIYLWSYFGHLCGLTHRLSFLLALHFRPYCLSLIHRHDSEDVNILE